MSGDFTTVRSVGGLLPPDLLRRIAAGDPELGLLAPADYGLRPGDRLGEAIARAWAKAKAYWLAFRAATADLPEGQRGTTQTRDQWLLPLLRDLGYAEPEFRAAAEEIGGRRFPIAYRADGVPLHLVSFRQGLDEPELLGTGRRVPPHALLQDYLNLSDAVYGLVSNGKVLRLLRQKASLTLQPYLEFDLEGMLEGGVYADFVLFFLTLHRSRLPHPQPLPVRGGELGASATTERTAARPHGPTVEPSPSPFAPLPSRGGAGGEVCPLDAWRAKAELQGTRALDRLREGVEQAITELGGGFLAHPANEALRRTLAAGDLSELGFYAQLLRLVYRLIFLFAAEERDLLFPAGADARAKAIYAGHYAASRLRDMAPRLRDDARHDDLWRGFLVTCRLLRGDVPGRLAAPALGGGLFDADACPDLDGAALANDRFAEALVQLSYVRVEGLTRRVNYRDMDAEELGGVYEGLLERQPRVEAGQFPTFALVGSGQRKQTGSYYTPTALVEELIKSALEPVLAERLRGAKDADARRAAILDLAVCDPACGSGHFLLAAARRLATELARVEAGDQEPTPPALRRALREVIRHCLYGVDANPLAVDLCKLALWLEGQEPGLPLTFLDHRIRLGNSLIGATPDLMDDKLPDGTKRPEPGLPDDAFAPVTGDDKARARGVIASNRRERRGQARLDLDGRADWEPALARLAQHSARIGGLPEERAAEVREQRAAYEAFDRGERETARAGLDAWTAAFFWPLAADAPEPPTTDLLRAAGPERPPRLLRAQSEMVAQLRERHRFFHWPIEFPEVFQRGGFDVVLGNPPWEMLQLTPSEFFAGRDDDIANARNMAHADRLIAALPQHNPVLAHLYTEAKRAIACQQKFVHGSGRFPKSSVGRINLAPLFAETGTLLLSPQGRAGVIVPTGIATDSFTQGLFRWFVEGGRLVSLFDFENRKPYFEAVDSRTKFSLLTLAAAPQAASDLAFMLTDTAQLADPRRRFTLGPADFALLNPNTRTCPIFRTTADAELTRAIYRRVPVLFDERNEANLWGYRGLLMFMMNTDSYLFHGEPGPGRVPLYEAKLFHQFTHRWATYTPWGDTRDVTEAELADPAFAVTPRYWVDRWEVEERLKGKWDRQWLVGWRRNARNTDERTMIASVLPETGCGDSVFLCLPGRDQPAVCVACFVGNLGALVLDFSARQKVSGVNLNFYLVEQFPILPPAAYTSADIDYIAPRVLELVYTAHDLAPFARDMGCDGPPFPWDPERRALLRAELDAYYAALYGLTRDELRYVLDPSDVYGPDFPGETFRVLKERELKQYGEYRTRRLVLEAWDRLGLAPRNRDGQYAAEGAALSPGLSPKFGGEERQRQDSGATRAVPARVVKEPEGAGFTWQSPLFGGAPRPSLFDEPPLPNAAAQPNGALAGTRPTSDPPANSASPSAGEPSAKPAPASTAAPVAARTRTQLRWLIVDEAARLLAEAGPQSSTELARRLAALDPSVHAFLVANVLQTEGEARIGFDGKRQKYFLKRR